jgi:cytochrome c oxidase subunit I
MSEKPEIHLPPPSYWPIALAFGMTLIGVGVVSNFIVSIVGVIVMVVSIAGWTMENRKLNQEEHHE